MSGTSDKISGKTKNLAGRVTDNKKLQAKGKIQEASGNVKDRLKDAGEKLSTKVEEATNKSNR